MQELREMVKPVSTRLHFCCPNGVFQETVCRLGVGILLLGLLFSMSCAVPLYKVAKGVPKKPLSPPKPPREPGSLWTVDSKWNDLYSFTAGRDTGDILFVQPSEQLATLVAKQAGRELAKDYKSQQNKKDGALELIPVTIREVLPRGVYLVESAPKVNIPEVKESFSFKGNVRERDISAEDIVLSESLHDFTLAMASPDLSARRRVDSLDTKDIKEEAKEAAPSPEGKGEGDDKKEEKTTEEKKEAQ